MYSQILSCENLFMNVNKYAGRRKRRKIMKRDPFDGIRVWIPKHVMRKFETLSQVKGISVSRLMTRVIVNAWEYPHAFEMDLSLPGGAEPNNADMRTLYAFIAGAGSIGVDLDLLVLCYEEIDMVSSDQVRESLAGLLHLGLAEFAESDSPMPRVRVVSSKVPKKNERFILFAGEKVRGKNGRTTRHEQRYRNDGAGSEAMAEGPRHDDTGISRPPGTNKPGRGVLG